MKNTSSTFSSQNQSLLKVALFSVLILLVPFVAMQFSEEFNWGIEDFIFAGVFFFSAGLVYEFGIKRTKDRKVKVAVSLVALVTFALIWIEAAVGIFD